MGPFGREDLKHQLAVLLPGVEVVGVPLGVRDGGGDQRVLAGAVEHRGGVRAPVRQA